MRGGPRRGGKAANKYRGIGCSFFLAARDYSFEIGDNWRERVTNDRPFFASELLSRASRVAGYDNKIAGNGR